MASRRVRRAAVLCTSGPCCARARPRQWSKNLLVFAAPGAAGVLSHGHDAAAGRRPPSACSAWCLGHVLRERRPRRRLRPPPPHQATAPGGRRRALGGRSAAVVGAAAQVGAVGLAWWLAGWRLAARRRRLRSRVHRLFGRLKHIPVIELACVSSGFVLRAIAGGVATGVALSDWFLIVTSFGSLLVVAGKRSAEHTRSGRGPRRASRPALSVYPAAFLRSVRLIAASVTLTRLLPVGFRAVGAGGPFAPSPPAVVRAVDRARRAGRAPPRAALRIGPR